MIHKIILCLFMSLALYGGVPPKITLRVNPEQVFAYQPIVIYITVVHKASEKIDSHSFLYKDVPLSVDILQCESIGMPGDDHPDMVTRLRALLPALPAGVATIGPIRLKLQDISYSSGITTIHVQQAMTSDDFRLQSSIDAPSKIFPGQSVTFEYVVYFSTSMKVTREEFPLFACPGFVPIDSVHVETVMEKGTYKQTITQKARATQSGSYSVLPGVMEAMTVVQDHPVLPVITAKSAQHTIIVEALPPSPEGFDGAIGAFTWRVIQEKNVIEYRVTGRGEMATVTFPVTLLSSCRVEAVREDDGSKVFIVVPKDNVEMIPGFIHHSFDPISSRYVASSIAPVVVQTVSQVPQEVQAVEKAPLLHEQTIPFWVVLVMAVVALGIGIIEWRYTRHQSDALTSRDLMYKAVRIRGKEGLILLKRALYLRVYELGLVPTIYESTATFTSGILLDVRAVIDDIDHLLYGGSSKPQQEMYDNAADILYRLRILGEKR